MEAVPETQYARSGDVHIAYQVKGDGPVDLVFFGPLVSHVELIWDDPTAARFLDRLAGFSRLIIFDKRGVGMSDPAAGSPHPTLEERLDDVRSVLDAAGSEEAVLFGNSEGGPLAVLMATSDPGRVRGLVLFGCYARLAFDESTYLQGIKVDDLEQFLAGVDRYWGSPRIVDPILPSLANDEAGRRWWATFFRRAMSPGASKTQLLMNYETDVSHLLPLVQAPTLIMHGRDDRFIPAVNGRYLADHIPGARWLELPTADHLPFAGASQRVADEVEEFLTGAREPAEPDRMLATVLFSDVVDSTARAASEGDQRWLDLLNRHDRVVRHELDRFRGREVRHTGDGFLAVFDGPARAIRCGRAICEGVEDEGLRVRVGIHTGEVELRHDEYGGIALHIGARVADHAGPSEIVVSHAIPPLVVGSGLEFEELGTHSLKGVPGDWQLLRVLTA